MPVHGFSSTVLLTRVLSIIASLWGGLGYAQEDFVSVPDPQALGASSKIFQLVQSRDAAKLCRMSVEGEKSASA